MLKSEVEYKLPKKMKKRRQLDALVDIDKLPRGRKNSSSAQELLDYHSDSSETEEFSAPSSLHRSKKCCFCHHIMVRVGLFMVTMACFTTCIGLVWVQWHIRHELSILRKQVETVQNSETGTTDIMTLKSQLANMNNTVTALKAGPIQSMTSNIAEVQTQLKNLKTVTNDVKHSEHSELVTIPKKLESLTGTVATITNEMNVLKDTSSKMTDALGALTTKVTSLETKAADPNPQDFTNRDVETVETLLNDVQNVNETLQTRLAQITQALTDYEVRLTSVENKGEGSSLSADIKSSDVEAKVTALVKEMLANQTASSEETSSPEDLRKLTEQVSTILEDVAKLQSASSSGVEVGEFLAFKAATQQDLESVNSSLLVLNTEVSTLTSGLSTLDHTVINLTALVNKLAVQKTQEPNAETKQDEPVEGAIPDSEIPPATEGGEKKQTSAPQSTDELTSAAITEPLKIEGVNSLKDLNLILTSIPLQSDAGQYRPEDLKQIIDPKLLSPYDTDKNGRYSSDELSQALGFMQERRFPLSVGPPNLMSTCKT